MRGPDFIIVGAMKSATTTLHEQLARQDGIFMSKPKEPCYFSDDERWARGPGWYASLFEPAAPGDLCGESSTHYTKLPTHPLTVERMRPVVGDGVRFVYVMRHPIERLVSQYVHEWSHRVLDCPIGEALDRYPELIAYSRYAMQLEPYLDAFGPERVLPVFAERLRAEPQGELERIAGFVGYRGAPRWSDDADARNASSDRMRASSLRDSIVNAPVLGSIRRRLVPRAATERVKRLWMLRRRPELTEAETQRLRAVFDEDLARLGVWLGVELSCDTFEEVAARLVPAWTGAPSGRE